MKKSSILPDIVLRVDLIRRGDVLLTHGSDIKSKAVAKFSGGQFSHAALCVNQYMTFESDMDVIGHRLIHVLGIANLGKEQATLGRIPGDVAHCAVYRHPSMEAVSEKSFSEALALEMQESYGKDYSELYRLVGLSNLPPSIQSLIDQVARLYERKSENVHGPFCSELVSRFFGRVGLSLFDDDRRPEAISPSDLAKSKLELVEGACLQSEGIQLHQRRPDVKAFLDRILPMPFVKAEDYLFPNDVDVLSRKRRQQRGVERALKGFNSAIDELKEANSANIEVLFSGDVQIAEIFINGTPRTASFRQHARVERVRRQYAELLPEVAAIRSQPFDSNRYTSFLDKLQSCSKVLVRSAALSASERLRAELREIPRQQLSGFRRWQKLRARKKVLTLNRQVLRSMRAHSFD
jgi:hypothetical protein